MKLIFKSVYLFLLGVYVEFYKRRFDYIMDKTLNKGGDISRASLTRRSNRCYALYIRFKDYEKELRHAMSSQRT